MEKTPLREAFPWLGAITYYSKPSASGVSPTNADNEKGLLGDDKKGVVMINGKEIKKKTPKKKKNNIGAAAEQDPVA